MEKVNVIGAGLAGCECALKLSEYGVKVNLFDIKPNAFTPAHKNADYGELVCSNSLKSNDIYSNACGLLKEEMRLLNSHLIKIADEVSVPAGNALAVDREKFARLITEKVKADKNITCVSGEITDIDENAYTVIATGPLTTQKLSDKIISLVGGRFSFYDASAPIVTKDSIDMDNAFFGDRYNRGNGDHINCPMNKDEYEAFYNALISAERVDLHEFEKREVFEGCMPIEIMAGRGKDTLRFGPLKPVGLDDPKTGRWAYATLQLRRENEEGTMYNLVGFQTNLKFGEQKRVFGLIPALRNAEYVRYGVMHKNSFIDSPSALNDDYSLKTNGKIFFAGQITGVEGYVESMASGLIVGIYLARKIKGEKEIKISERTVIGALTKYITTKNDNFEPMNANFGILPQYDLNIKDKKEKKKKLAEISLSFTRQFIKEIE
ncbi:MAG: methylenetetrahydrofolate--tRNA-(uracil(54)-C(5))-methyltransferase (FADH(2)-oxidizing) TrmFO [Clostridia bacterium]|nr:methylenetetrahydrofolate--tRNA-(uracil(54)-C(5))-methyltransferase (FADH(2)-oxidizing) TrmFO [Clostridia bacterium]